MSTKLLGYTQGIIGGAANDLDSIGLSTLGTKDPTFVITTGIPRTRFDYQFDTGSTGNEVSPVLISPDGATSSGGRHHLTYPYRKQFVKNCTAAQSLGATQLGGHITFTNYGASSSLIKLTLVQGTSDLSGIKLSMLHMTSGKFGCVGNTSQRFHYSGSTSAKGSYLQSTSVGNAVTLVYGGNNKWFLHPIDGTWNYTT